MQRFCTVLLVVLVSGCFSAATTSLRTPTTSYDSRAVGVGVLPVGAAGVPAYAGYSSYGSGYFYGSTPIHGVPIRVAPSERWSAPFVPPPSESVPRPTPASTVHHAPSLAPEASPADAARMKALEEEVAASRKETRDALRGMKIILKKKGEK